jgi:uncharacterized protein YuzE
VLIYRKPSSEALQLVRLGSHSDLDENTLLDVGADGNICAITVEHAIV